MSRFRSKSYPATLPRFWDGEVKVWMSGRWQTQQSLKSFTLYPISSSSDGNCLYDKIRYSEMTDISDTGGRPYHIVDHTTYDAAYFSPAKYGVDNFDMAITIGSYTFRFLLYKGVNDFVWVRPKESLFKTSLDSAFSGYDWTNSVVALANAVKGLVNSKSLLAVTIKELPSAVRMVTNPFGLLKRDWRKIAQKHTAAELAKSKSNLWLEYQYGWNATYNDFVNFSKTTTKYLRSTEQYRATSIERFGKKTTSLCTPLNPTISDAGWATILANCRNGSLNGGSVYGPPVRIRFLDGRVTRNVSCRCDDVLQRQTSQLHKLLFAYGLSSSQIVDSIWEAVPYSFVVDWFVDTNRIMNAFRMEDAVRSLSSAGVSHLGYSTKAEIPYVAQMIVSHGSSADNWDWRWGAMTPTPNSWVKSLDSMPGSVRRYQRNVGFPSNGLSVFENKGLSVQQGISGFALLFQRILGR